jgi:hypothetical protein
MSCCQDCGCSCQKEKSDAEQTQEAIDRLRNARKDIREIKEAVLNPIRFIGRHDTKNQKYIPSWCVDFEETHDGNERLVIRFEHTNRAVLERVAIDGLSEETIRDMVKALDHVNEYRDSYNKEIVETLRKIY